MTDDLTDRQRQLLDEVRAGRWLRPGDVATVLGVDRRTVDRMLRGGALQYRVKPGSGRHREVEPAGVLREFAARRQVIGGGEVSGTATTGHSPRNDENPARSAGSSEP